MLFVPGDLHLYTDGEGFTCVVLKGETIGRFRSEKEGIRKFHEIRSGLEDVDPKAELSDEEKHKLLLRDIGDSLTRHNSLRNSSPRKRTGTRTFG